MALPNDFESGLTRDRLDELFDIDVEAGAMKWKACPRPGRDGMDAGCLTVHGYAQVKIDGRFYRRSRVIWFYGKGAWPSIEIDHRNLVKSDDRIDNLREATFSQNMFNTPIFSSNTSGCKGVDWRPDKKRWRARIMANGRTRSLGHYKSYEAAVAARNAAAEVEHGEFARAA